jgi:hypothetical protein
MQRPRHDRHIAPGVVWLALLGVLSCASASAGLKAQAPKDVDLTGSWNINTQLSDDPQKILKERRAQARPSLHGGFGGMRGSDAGSSGGIPGSGGRGGMGRPTGSEPGGMRGGSGGWDERGVDAEDRSGERGEPDASTQRMLATRESLEIVQQDGALTLKDDDGDTTCKPDEVAQVSMPNGTVGDRRCGWDRKAFVVELKPPQGISRNERYELSPDGRQLVLTTELKGGRGPMSGIKIKRVYDRSESR